MREPATSCTVCRRVLGPGGVLYTPDAEVVCEACLASTAGAHGAPAGSVAPARTRFERARALQGWAALWVALAGLSVGVMQQARARWPTLPPLAIIETPEPWAAVPAVVTVRGLVAGLAPAASLWVVARSGEEGHCGGFARERVAPSPGGAFSTTLTLNGDRGKRFWIQLVEADARANAFFGPSEESSWLLRKLPDEQGGRGCRHIPELEGARLPPGVVPLASAGVVLAEDNPWPVTSMSIFGR